MAKKSTKKEVLDLYASAIAREQTKYDKASKKSLGKTQSFIVRKRGGQ
jgi:hypothetical protein